MTEDEIINALMECIETYGPISQTDMAIEEASELIKALCKIQRTDSKDRDARDNVIEEIADVQIMLLQMMMLYSNRETIKKKIDEKVARQMDRMQALKDNGENK